MISPTPVIQRCPSGLVLIGKAGDEEIYQPLKSGANSIGSSSANDLELAVVGVSRRHALLIVEEQAIQILDHGSKNGTFVNAERITTSCLKPGDQLWIGPVELRLEASDDDGFQLAVDLTSTARPRLNNLAPPPTTVEVQRREPATQDGWSDVVRLCVDRAGGLPHEEFSHRLGRIMASTGIVAACVLELCHDEETVMLEIAGPIERLQTRRVVQAWKTADQEEMFLLEPGLTCIARKTGDVALAIVLAGSFAERRKKRALLLALLTLYDLLRHPPSPLARPGREKRGSLVFPPGYIRGTAAASEQLYANMENLAATDLPVLITGETGVGKELVARALHLSSERRDAPFVAINCAAIPADLVEAELFGIGRGVATGVSERSGLFRKADGGTLFLDEIGDLPANLQVKLLRVLQEQEVTPLGAPPVSIDVRLIAATNAEIYQLMDDGLFRRDLYYRLAGAALRVPPLRQRRADLPLLIDRFLRRAVEQADKKLRGMTVSAQKALSRCRWPGNVRELEHEIRRLVHICPPGGAITMCMVSEQIVSHQDTTRSRADLLESSLSDPRPLPVLDLAELEKIAIETALRRAAGRRGEAARILGVSRFALLRRLKRHGL